MSSDTVYQMVTEKVVAMLEEGTVPWRKPWKPAAWPRNINGHRYRGINLFLLSFSAHESPFWLTFNQAKKMGGSVKKGEQSTVIVFWKRLRVTDKDPDTGKPVPKIIPMLRYYRVFNLEQTEEVKVPRAVLEYQVEQLKGEASLKPLEEAEAIVKGYPNPPAITATDSDQAFYTPALDQIVVPKMAQYRQRDEYYSTLFHEMGHSTGHPDRLARKLGNAFGSHDYGREELVAEMTAAFLCSEAGIAMTLPNSAAYLQSWIRTIKEDTKAVVVAAGQAQRAADLILHRTFTDTESDIEPGDQPALAATG